MLMQMTLAVFVLLQLFSRDISAISADRLVKEFCGFEQKCAEYHTDVEQMEDSCCKPCECIETCKEKETCCADIEELANTTDVIKQQCLPAAYMPEGVQELTGINSYYTRAHCPEEFEDSNIKEKCENKTAHSLDDITFVSSEDGTFVYKNKFCGLCHGEKRTIPWSLTISLDCGVTLFEQNLTLKNILLTLLTKCAISMTEPRHLAVENTVCFDRSLLISECNNTGEWEQFDSDLQELCLNSSGALYYYHMSSKGLLIYRSLYCYLCNSKTNDARETCASNIERFTALETLLRLNNDNLRPSSEDHETNSNECSENQILDTFFNICRSLFCPTFFLPRYGHCIPIIDTKFHYPLVVRIVAQELVDNSESIKNELKSLYVDVLKRLGFGGCKWCHVYFYMKRNLNESLLPELYLRFALTTTEKCNIDKLLSNLAEFEMRHIDINIRLNQKLRLFRTFWDYQTSWQVEKFETVLILKRSKVCPILPLTRASHCPKVKLLADEYQVVLKNHVNAADLLFAPNQEDGSRTVYVCCDKYLVNKRSTGVGNELHVVMAFAEIVIIAGAAFQHN